MYIVKLFNCFSNNNFAHDFGLLGPLRTTFELNNWLADVRKYFRFGYTNATYDYGLKHLQSIKNKSIMLFLLYCRHSRIIVQSTDTCPKLLSATR